MINILEVIKIKLIRLDYIVIQIAVSQCIYMYCDTAILLLKIIIKILFSKNLFIFDSLNSKIRVI